MLESTEKGGVRNSVLNPGTVIGPHSNVYPTSCVRGMVPANSIWKTGGIIVAKK